MNNLPKWKVWCDWVRSHPDNSSYRRLNQANARYRLAVSFKGLELDGISLKTTQGYSAALRLMLSYSAAEMLAKSLGSDIKKWEIVDANTATLLRQLLNDKKIVEHLNKTMQKNLIEFINGSNDNIRIAATALRHLMAHGDLTVNGLGINSVRDQTLVNQVAQSLLEECQKHFEDWLDHQMIK